MRNANLAVIEQPATTINNLHKELREHGLSMVEKAIQAGGLLVEQKERLGHGHWLEWVKGNLVFGGRTAQHYIKCYQHRDQLNAKSVSHLGKAVNLLASPKKELRAEGAILVQSVPKKSESSISEEQGPSRKSQRADTDKTVVSLAPKACGTPKLSEWHTVRQASGWYSGHASNKVRGRCNELKAKFDSLHLEMIKFFRNDANASKEKLLREDWKRLYEETNCFATWLFDASQEMRMAAGLKSIKRHNLG